MTYLWADGYPIRVQIDVQERLLAFYWQERKHRIRQLGRRWEVQTDWWETGGTVWRGYVTVITEDGLRCELYQDLLTEEWYLERVYD